MIDNDKMHHGHRQRVRKRFLESGLEGFEDYQVLELLLFYCIPRQNTNPIAHNLIKHFGSLSQVMSAPIDELKKVPGMGESAATFLSLLNSFCRYFYANRDTQPTILDSFDACKEFLFPHFLGQRNEVVQMVCMDAKGKLLCHKILGEGSVNSAAVPIRRIVEIALGSGATTVVLAHNHPSGVAIPSPEDELITRQLASALFSVDITLLDHIIIAEDEVISMRQSGKYHPQDCRMLF